MTASNNVHEVAIAATTLAATSEAFELRATASMQNPVNYSVISSPLGAGEKVTVEIWNEASNAWQVFNREGAPVELTQNNDWLGLDAVSLRVRFVKTATAAAVGVALVRPRSLV